MNLIAPLCAFAKEAERQQGSPICLSQPGCLYHSRHYLGSARFPVIASISGALSHPINIFSHEATVA